VKSRLYIMTRIEFVTIMIPYVSLTLRSCELCI
jgi:hypothetical protein